MGGLAKGRVSGSSFVTNCRGLVGESEMNFHTFIDYFAPAAGRFCIESVGSVRHECRRIPFG